MSTQVSPGQEERQAPGLWEEDVRVYVCTTEGKCEGAWTEEVRCDNEQQQEEEEEAEAWTATCAHGHLVRLRPLPAPLPHSQELVGPAVRAEAVMAQSQGP